MNNFISSAIASIASFVKFSRLKQALVVLFAGFILVATTACGENSTAASARSYDYNAAPGTYGANERPSQGSSPYDKGTGPQRELYKPTQKVQGGMNNYNDDPKYDQKGANAKAKGLIDRAESRLQNRATNPKEALDNAREYNPIPDQAREFSDKVKQSVADTRENLTAGTQKGVRNLKENAEKARDAAPDVIDRAKQNAADATKDVREGVDDLADSARNSVNRSADGVQARGLESTRDRS
jgi:hypothetical protein